MDKAEHKSILKGIKEATQDAIAFLRGNKKWLEVTERDVKDLFIRFETIDGVDSLSEDDIISEVKKSLFDKALVECYDLTRNYIDDLNDYIDELSEDGDERVEFYNNRINILNDDVLSKFDNDDMEYYSIDQAVEHLEEVLETLSYM